MSLLYRKESRAFPSEIRNLSGIYKIPNSSLLLKGSSSLKVVKYFSDYDFLCYYKIRNINKLYNDIKKLMESLMNNTNYYFIELKIQNEKNQKFRYNFNDDFNLDKFSDQMENLKFFKIDVVVWLEGVFMESSCLYLSSDILQKKQEDTELFETNIFNEVMDELDELDYEGQFFKLLKRYYFLFSFHPKTYGSEMNDLLKFFNSEIGKLYQEKSELLAMKRVLLHYNDNLTIKRSRSFLKSLNIDEDHLYNIDYIIDEYDGVINSEAKKIIKKYNINKKIFKH